MKCPNCGREIAENSLFCEYCRTKIETSQEINKIPLKGGRTPMIKGVEGMTLQQIYTEVNNGAKFVYFPYTISCVARTFVLPSDIYFIRQNENKVSQGLIFGLLNLLLGWWGIPFGPIYTLKNLALSFSGIDVTEATVIIMTRAGRENVESSYEVIPQASMTEGNKAALIIVVIMCIALVVWMIVTLL